MYLYIYIYILVEHVCLHGVDTVVLASSLTLILHSIVYDWARDTSSYIYNPH